MSRLFAVLLLLVSSAAVAVPIRIDTIAWTFRPDHAITSDVVTNADLQIGDCMTCWNRYDSGLDYRISTDLGDVVSFTDAKMELAQSLTENTASLSALVDLDVRAHVPEGVNGASFARIALSNFTFAFEVLEPVYYTGSTGLRNDELRISYFGSTQPGPIRSGNWLDPGFYWTSMQSGYIGTDGYLYYGSLDVHREIALNYAFSTVPVPASAGLVAFGLLGLWVSRRRRVTA
jgi:MYXO-CTERM domain-containing protein